MKHWASKYIGQPWTETCDCGEWFRRIQAEVFGRDVPPIIIDHARMTLSAARAMAGNIASKYGWDITDEPKDGDAVFLSQRARPHHIGTVTFIDGRLHVLHALEGVGIVLSDLQNLKINYWRIAGFYSCR